MPGSAASISATAPSSSSSYAARHWGSVKLNASGDAGGPPLFATRMSIGPSSSLTWRTSVRDIVGVSGVVNERSRTDRRGGGVDLCA